MFFFSSHFYLESLVIEVCFEMFYFLKKVISCHILIFKSDINIFMFSPCMQTLKLDSDTLPEFADNKKKRFPDHGEDIIKKVFELHEW